MKIVESAIMAPLLLALTVLIASCAGPSGEGAGGAASVPVTAMERPATGTAGDSLQACLGRIPSEASAGQRMLAEESCRRDEAARAAIQAVPAK